MLKGQIEQAAGLFSNLSLPPDLSTLCWQVRPQVGQAVRLIAVGDIGLSGRVRQQGGQKGYHTLWANVAPLLQSGNIVFGNLEGSVPAHSRSDDLFTAEPEGLLALASTGFDLLHLANNHIYDYGPEAIRSTLSAFQTAGLLPLGVGDNPEAARAPVRTDCQGKRIGWLGCGRSLGAAPETRPFFWELDEGQLMAAVTAVRPGLDYLIISIHAGIAYAEHPHPDHKALTDRLLSAGADLILMHNAHVLQGVRVEENGQVVCYNLGNFLMDWQEGHVAVGVAAKIQNEGAVFVAEIDDRGLFRFLAVPIQIEDGRRVDWAGGEQGRAILARIQHLSEETRGDYGAIFEQQRAERTGGLILQALRHHLRRGNWGALGIMFGRLRPYHFPLLVRWLWSKLRHPQSP